MSEATDEAAASAAVFEVVPRDRVPWRRKKISVYAEMFERLKVLDAGDSLKIQFPNTKDAERYAKGLSRQLRNHEPTVTHERQGMVIFLDVQRSKRSTP